VSSFTRIRTRAELVRDLQAAGVPCAPVMSIREVDTDEHLIQRGMIQYVEHPGRGRVPVPGCPLRLADSPVGQLQAAPALGQATEEILAELRRHAEAADAGIPSPEREDAPHVVYT
jgi:formyl-CoA transferase